MKLYVGVTDQEWFEFLARREPDEVNFWRPGGSSNFRAIESGAPFLFKLHSPLNFIVGGGFFVRYSALPLSLVWDAFQEKNGAADYVTFEGKIRAYRKEVGARTPDPQIGCIILTAPFFFARKDWIPIPTDWQPNVVQGKTYDTATVIGAELWERVEYARMNGSMPSESELSAIAEESPRYGSEYLARARLGQGAFRVLVTDAYQRRCSITGERTLPVLNAAHIKPFSKSGPHRTNNGLLLRADMHILFDTGFLTVGNDYHVVVSKRIKEEYENGREYYAFHGKPLAILPNKVEERPLAAFLEWHNENVFTA